MSQLSGEQIEKICKVVKKILKTRRDKFPEPTQLIRNAPYHERFLVAFTNELKRVSIPIPYLVAIASWMHGLNTSLGNGFESLAHILSGGRKRKFTKKSSLRLRESQVSKIDEIIRDLKAGNRKPNLKKENELIAQFARTDPWVGALEFTVDNFCESEDSIEAIELKSVRPNSGEGRGEKQKILHAKAALQHLYPKKKIKYYVGFPFDPTSSTPTGYDKERFFDYLVEFKKFFAPDEVLIADELWDRLSGTSGTMQQILDVISETIDRFNNSR